jgi:hypothetical protein
MPEVMRTTLFLMQRAWTDGDSWIGVTNPSTPTSVLSR